MRSKIGLLYVQITGLDSEVYYTDNGFVGNEFFDDIHSYINARPYLVFKPETTESEIVDIRQQMEEMLKDGELEPSYYFENSKFRINKIESAIKSAHSLLTEMKDFIEFLPKDSLYKLDPKTLTDFLKTVQKLWKKERAEKISDIKSDMDWPELYSLRNSLKSFFQSISEGKNPEPVLENDKPISDERMQEIFDLVRLDEAGDYFNIDQKIDFIRTYFINWMRSLLCIYEVFSNFKNSGINYKILSPEDVANFIDRYFSGKRK